MSMDEDYREYIGKNILWVDVNLNYRRGKLQYYSEQIRQWVVRVPDMKFPIYVSHLSILSTEYTRKVSWADCNWAPAHVLRIVTQDNLHLYNKQVLNDLKLKGYYSKLGGNI